MLGYLVKAEREHGARLDPASPHLARVRAELAINLVNRQGFEAGLDLLNKAIPVFAALGADWQLTHALRWRAIALAEIAETEAARAAAFEALAWARYVYGRDSRAAAVWRQEFEDLGVAPRSG